MFYDNYYVFSFRLECVFYFIIYRHGSNLVLSQLKIKISVGLVNMIALQFAVLSLRRVACCVAFVGPQFCVVKVHTYMG